MKTRNFHLHANIKLMLLLNMVSVYFMNLDCCSAQEIEEWVNDAVKMGSELYEAFAPPEIKAQYSVPDPQEWQIFWTAVNTALKSGTPEDLARVAPYAHQALDYMEMVPALDIYSDWLRQRLDYFDINVVSSAVSSPPATQKSGKWPLMPPALSRTDKPRTLAKSAHQINTWKARIKSRQQPANAAKLISELKDIFEREGIPPELVWMAEVESSLNPLAQSPAGAVGLFQFMPATAERFGLNLRPQDERQNPVKSAKAAAQYLRFLHKRFGSWPLAIAAYNCGEGRLGKTLSLQAGKSFEEIASALPSETQMYVPKVLATVGLRENIDPLTLPSPSGRPASDR